MMPVLVGLWLIPGVPGASITSWLLHLRDKKGQENSSGGLEEVLILSMIWGTIFWFGIVGFTLWKILNLSQNLVIL